MNIKKISKLLSQLLIFSLFASIACNCLADDQFKISDIRVEGLQRMTPGTVFNYLPVQVGDMFNDQVAAEATQALFKTGFFDDIKLERDGNVLVVIVKERPAIGSIDISGNKDIKTKDLMKGLEDIGFAVGRVFNQSQLDQLERELKRQYTSRGKYGVKVTSTVTPLGNNRVGVSVKISEGKAARIKQINIVGNHAFKEKTLLNLFKLTGPTLISFFTKTDQYSREKFSGDLEKLSSFYRDRGYINFDIDSTQVELTPDKRDIYITINITEGSQYRVSDVKLAGNLILPEQALFPWIVVKKNGLFNLKDVTDSSKYLTDRLGYDGYAFANVNFIPHINEKNKTVAITFHVDPGQRVYVRRINFSGNNKTRDEVLRREMRQQEGAWVATPLVNLGKTRLKRLGYFDDVTVKTPAVAGSTDLVDVDYKVTEKDFGQFTAGIGYGQTQGFIVQTSVAQNNFLGSGKRIQFAFSNSDVNRVLSFGYTNPYYTVDGISRTINLSYSKTNGLNSNITAFDNTVYGGGFTFGIPISETNTVYAGVSFEDTRLSQDGLFAREVLDFIKKNGSHFDVLRLTAAYSHDTRNNAIFPSAGAVHRISAALSIPSWGNSIEFYKLNYRGQWYKPLFWKFVFTLKGDVGYGQSFGSATLGLPFFENYYGGGPRDVRGFRENTLGPRDSFGNPLGGYMKITGGAAVLFPVPFIQKAKDSVRLELFMDAGNIYGYQSRLKNPLNPNSPLIRTKQAINLGDLRYSFGFGATWMSPFGIVSISFAQPFNTQPGDDIQQFQFNFGTNF